MRRNDVHDERSEKSRVSTVTTATSDGGTQAVTVRNGFTCQWALRSRVRRPRLVARVFCDDYDLPESWGREFRRRRG